MTQVMTAQTGLGLNAPSSRQDIVSALLSDYGSSFGQDDVSPYALSPVPAVKELPPPPPPSNNEKPLPSAMMRFQLRGNWLHFLQAILSENIHTELAICTLCDVAVKRWRDLERQVLRTQRWTSELPQDISLCLHATSICHCYVHLHCDVMTAFTWSTNQTCSRSSCFPSFMLLLYHRFRHLLLMMDSG